MSLGEAVHAIMRMRGPRAAWAEHDACLERLHPNDHGSFRREFNRIASERKWPGRSYGGTKRKADTRPDEWRSVKVDPDMREQFEAYRVACRIEYLDQRISSLRAQVNRRADGWEWCEG
jgi:hypothetical protein